MIILEGVYELMFPILSSLFVLFTLSISQHADDMEIAPDFFDFFEAGAALMDSDKWGLFDSRDIWTVYSYVHLQFLAKAASICYI